ncbi:hypothetical protein [Gluconobacter kondonii]|uniref:hypothetical protein n=1 Tax=Gluconobacter kondonii TaxID=941463 RepID=UPI001B8D204A|nr:hypothetical protein [Gluconobacter kondonii]MBS1082360.1 hypothetical protein [Gluconobacter kondonii]
MGDYPERLEAMKLAIEFSAGCPMTAENLIFVSTVIENYLSKGSKRSDGSTVRVVFGAPDLDTRSSRSCEGAVNNLDGLTDDAWNGSPLGVGAASSSGSSSPAPINRNPISSSQGTGDVPDQSLAGQVFTHNSSSSADGESGDSVAADPRNDATPDTSEKGVRDDA